MLNFFSKLIGAAKRFFPSKPMTFEVGAGLTPEQKIKAEEIVRKPATPLKPVEYTPESKYRALGVATLLRSKGKEVPEVVAEAEKRMMQESAYMAIGGATPLKIVGKVATKAIPKISPVQKVIRALQKAKPIKIEQEILYAKTRGAKLAKMMAVAKKVTGEKGFFAEKGALKGKFPKVQFETLRAGIKPDITTKLFGKKLVIGGEEVGNIIKTKDKVGKIWYKFEGLPKKKFSELEKLKEYIGKTQKDLIKKHTIKVSQSDIDTLFNQVKDNPILSEWEKLPAREGLSKLFGEVGGQVPTKNELSLLKTVFGEPFVKAVLDKRTLLQKMTEAGIQLANIPRSIMASFDLSAPLRQGIFLAARHPKMFFSSFAKQFKTFASEKSYKGLMDDIVNRPTYKVMRENKLAITDLGQSMTTREEAFMSNWAEKIPLVGKVVRASGRAYTGFLNKMRADVFDDFVKQGTKLGIDDPKFLKSAANFVNHATGRGTLGGLEKAAVPLNTFFFSPRLIMSRLNLINPIYYAKLQPVVRKEAIKSLFAFAGMSLTIGGLLKMGGASVEIDPRNADFMKPKFGNTRYDILGGFQQPIRLAAQLISGKIISSTTGKTLTLGEGYKPLTRIGIIGRYFSYKEAPLISFAHSLLKGQTAIGEKVDIPTEIVNRFIPMVAQDMIDIYREEGIEGIPMAFPAIFGVGVQSYGGVESYNLQGRKYPELNEELDRLKTTIGFPSTQAFGTELSNKEYKKLREISGTMISDILTGVIKDPSYTELTDYQKKQLINKVVDKIKTKAKGKLFPEKDIKNEIKKRLVKKGIDEEEAKRMADEIYSKEY